VRQQATFARSIDRGELESWHGATKPGPLELFGDLRLPTCNGMSSIPEEEG
jgi:hypothetical protein